MHLLSYRIAALGLIALAASGCQADPKPAEPPTLGQIADSIGRGVANQGCAEIAAGAQDSLTSAGHRPAVACRWRSADTTTVILRQADSTVMSIVRIWAPLNLVGEYQETAARLDRTWGPGQGCPANNRGNVQGDRFYAHDSVSVRIYVQLPNALVVDYELAPGSCRPA
ncbi:MAG TPA: hypothetical protein VFL95_03915 [Gemmatimonadales bacterium]|nr:hypothetical protein [Gemmatimonadales bacterium]